VLHRTRAALRAALSRTPRFPAPYTDDWAGDMAAGPLGRMTEPEPRHSYAEGCCLTVREAAENAYEGAYGPGTRERLSGYRSLPPAPTCCTQGLADGWCATC
jgi:hypothetical protein